jgi:Putative beta barrel porin-7 (BBP7)
MMRRWVGVAVIAGCLGLAQAARAQFSPPPAGPDALPEPIPVSPEAGQANAPGGPVNPECAQPGMPDCLSLPNDGTGAFSCREIDPERAVFFNVGAQLFQRQKQSQGGKLAVLDPFNIDTGNLPPVGGRAIQEFSDIGTRQNGGPRATLGYLFNTNQSFELTGFYIFQSNQTARLQDPGRIDSPFFNPPLGFEGDNGLWLQADRMSTTLSTTLFSVEGNYRYTDAAVTGAELIVGVRYLDVKERITNTTDDDGVAFPLINGLADPTRIATYSAGAHNRLVAPQLGFEWDKRCCKWLTLGVMAKGAWGVDFVDFNRSLVRGDGFVGFTGKNSEMQFSQMYELNAFVDFHILERARIRLGYSTMWLFNVANAMDQVDFNLQNTSTFNNRNGSIYFQGPMAELQFLF